MLLGYVAVCLVFIGAGAGAALVASTSVPAIAIADPLDIGDASDGVAASLNEGRVGEAAVSRYIEDFRQVQGLTSDEEWGIWLVNAGYTPEMMRRDTAESLARHLVLRRVAEERGLRVPESAIDEEVRAARRLYPGTGDWERYLAAMSLTEAGLRFAIEQRCLAAELLPDGTEVRVEERAVLSAIRQSEERYKEAGSLDQVDDETRAAYRVQAENEATQEALRDLLDDRFSESGFLISEMPSGLPYDIGLEPYAAAVREASYGEEIVRQQSVELSPWGPVALKTEQEMNAIREQQDAEWKARWLVDEAAAQEDYDRIAGSYTNARAANDEVFCWLSVPGAELSVPVLQSKVSDDYYLYRGTNKQISIAGAVYAERATSTNLRDFVTVLYGHCSETQEVMFTKLHRYEDPDFFESNPIVYLHIQGRTFVYVIVSAYEYDSRHLLASFDLESEVARQEVFDFVANPNAQGALVREGVKLQADSDKILQLSGCTLPITGDKRFIVSAALVGEVDHASLPE